MTIHSGAAQGARPAGAAPGQPRAGWWGSGWVSSVVVFVCCFFSATLAAAMFDSRRGEPLPDGTTSMTGLMILLWLVGIALAIAMMWRRRWPVPIAIAAGVIPIVLPLDPLPALIVLGTVIIRCRGRIVWQLGALVTVATFAAVWKDTRGDTSDESFWRMVIDPSAADPRTLQWWTPVLITVLLVGVFAGVAYFWRFKSDLRLSEVQGEVQRRQVVDLHEEVGRQAERERLAREVHDALGHRLSLLSLHAGALEMATADGDPRVRASAKVVREGAQQSMDDLRSLLGMLRQPDSPDVAAATHSLGDVPALVDESIAAGMAVVSTVNLDGTDSLDPATNRSAYRITQELLTNARKHAPGIPVRVLVAGNAASGVTVEVANYLPRDETGMCSRPVGPVGRGNGLTGIHERAAQHGGEAHAWVDDDGVFRSAVHLPWQTTTTGGDVTMEMR